MRKKTICCFLILFSLFMAAYSAFSPPSIATELRNGRTGYAIAYALLSAMNLACAFLWKRELAVMR